MATLITKVWGIGSQTAVILAENGYQSAEDLAATTEMDLTKVPGFGPARAERIIESARSLVDIKQMKPQKTDSSATKKKKKKKDKKQKDKKKQKKQKSKKKEKRKNNKKDKKK